MAPPRSPRMRLTSTTHPRLGGGLHRQVPERRRMEHVGARLALCATSSAATLSWSEANRRADWDHRSAAGVDGVDDLGVVDSLEIDAGDAEIAVAELALDDDQRHALARELDRVRV